MQAINQDRAELIDGLLRYSALTPVRAGSTETFQVTLIAYPSGQPVPARLASPRERYNLQVGGVEGATLTAPGGGVTITAIGPARRLIGKSGDAVSWTWSLKPTQPGTHVLDLVVVTYQGNTNNALYTLNPPVVLRLVARNSLGQSFAAIENALLPVFGLAASLAAVLGVVLTWIAMRKRKRRSNKAAHADTTAPSQPADVVAGDEKPPGP